MDETPDLYPALSSEAPNPNPRVKGKMASSSTYEGGSKATVAHQFRLSELAAATQNFREDFYLREGGFGKVYKGRIESEKKVVAIKQLNPNGLQGHLEFLVEVLTWSIVHHPNLAILIGYCAEGDQRLLVYEYMPNGSLADHLHGREKPLDCNARINIAAGAAKGLEHLHDKVHLKASNILLDENYHPKLSGSGKAKFAPTQERTGQLSVKLDIYSFGVVLLEIITGRKPVDTSAVGQDQHLVSWARPLLKNEANIAQMADPALQGQYPSRGLAQALNVAALCIQEQPDLRPPMADVI